MKFVVKKRLELSFLGDDWNDKYIEFAPLTYKDLETMQGLKAGVDATPEENKASTDTLIGLLKKNFIGGKGVGPNGPVDISKEDITDLPAEVINKAISLISGNPDPK